MNIDSFENFDLHSQACITWRKGVRIGHRSQGDYYMLPYCLADFYVEVQYQTCYDGIASIQSFSCEEQLQPYLDQVNLKEILPFC